MSDENKEILENNQEENQNNTFENKGRLNVLNKLKHRVPSYLILFLIMFIGIITSGCTNLFSDIPEQGKWIVAPVEMSKKRSFATANLLPDGNVLIMGGEDNSADTADIFDPDQMKIVKTIKLNDKRYYGYSATTLKNGDVFVAGGWSPEKLNDTTKIFDAKTYSFRDTKSLKYRISNVIAYLLPNDNVLLLNNIIKTGGIGRENMRFQIYIPEEDEYIETKNMIHRLMVGKQHMILDNGDVLFKCFFRLPGKTDKGLGSTCLYNWKENKFEVADEIPHEQLFIQLDSENYLTMTPGLEHTEGYTYNIKTRKKTRVKNKINRTWRPGIYPQLILLENGDVLILGISLKNNSDNYETSGNNRKTSKYSAYIYSRSENNFLEIQAPPFPVYHAGIVRLKNGDILLAGGTVNKYTISNKIQVFRYKK